MKEFDVAIEAARAAGEILREQYEKTPVTRHKADNTEVSDADLVAEKVIIETIRKSFPDHGIFSEEAGSSLSKSEYLWIIDPLDGSTNFLHHLSHFCTAIALVRENQPLLGVIYAPLAKELFAAQTNQPASVNSQPITSSNTAQLSHSLIHFGRSALNTPRHARVYQAIAERLRTLRLTGSTALGGVFAACGRVDAHVHSDVKLYDILAAAVIAQSAGARVTDFSGNPWQPDFSDPTSTSDVLISNPHLHADLVAALKGL